MSQISSNYEKMPNLGRRAGGERRFRPIEKPKDPKETLKRLLKLLLKYWKTLIMAVIMTVASSGIGIFSPYFMGKAINSYDVSVGSVDSTLLAAALISLVGCYVIGWLTDTLSGVLMVKATQRFVKHIRLDLFSKLQRIPLGFYDSSSHGDTMSRITNDVDNISSTISQITTQLAASILTIFGTLIMMLILNPVLAAVTLISVPLFFLLSKTITKHSRKYFLGQQRILGTLNAIIEESITGIKMVKAFNKQSCIIDDFKGVNRELCVCATKAQIWAGLMMPIMNVINNLSFALIACTGGIMIVRGMTSIGVVVSFLAYSKQFGMPLNSIAGIFNSIQSALAGAERVFETLDEAELPPDGHDAMAPTDVKGTVEFQGVSFSYVLGKTVLKNVSFSVNPGEVIALVGETGAGKTTIVNLLTRFYEPESGRILIDGNNICNIKRSSLHDYFSVVLQDTSLFSGTIYDNIKYSKPSASDEEVVSAARLAHADEFISRLPNGYSTAVTGSADNLSLGQRQLIAIARAILRSAPILILDEATSSVDTKTEKDIQRALLTLMKNRTSFLIAHRLSTIRDADKILVVDRGEIMEMGTHNDLMERKGLYYNMVISQMGTEYVASQS